MKRNNDNRNSWGETAETIFYLLLPFLCVASLFRGCSARSAEIADSGQQTSFEQEHMRTDSEDSEGADHAEDAEDAEPDESGGGEDYYEEDEPVRENMYDPDKFSYVSEDSENITYLDDNYEVLQGIDVSEHQAEIDWQAVADAGYKFVFVRLGFRGYGEEGTLNEDTRAIEYLRDAKEAGLLVGAYFFSQALNEEEAAEEARFAAEIVKKSGIRLDLPLVYDPETAGGSAGRANNLSSEQVSLNAAAFRDAAESELKCKTAIYANLYWENNYFENKTLNDFEIWYAGYEIPPATPYHFTWWQYSETGSVPGIKGAMDLNLWIRQTD